jgi:hypothetical protein
VSRWTRPAEAGVVVIVAAGLVAVALVLWWLGPWRSSRVVAPPPPVVADLPLEDVLEASSLSVPVRVDLRTLVDEVEEEVPTEWGSVEQPVEVENHGRTDALLSLTRSPFRAELDGAAATLATTVAYRIEATYDLPLLPDLNLGCGDDPDEPRPRLDITLAAPISLTSDWRLSTTTRVQRIAAASSEERDRCEVTFAGFDITGRVEDAARGYLQEHAAAIDSLVAGTDVRSSFEEWWNVLREPIALDESVWLELRPRSIRRGAIRGEGDIVEIAAQLGAAPRVLLGERPDRWPEPLPPLGAGVDEGGLNVLVEAMAEYPATSRRLNEALAGIEVRAAGGLIEIGAVALSGIGGGRLAMEVAVAGDLQGRLFLVGTPHFDPARGDVSVPDLEFSVETSSLLLTSASWALGAQLDRLLRERARWPVDLAVTWAGDRLDEGLNRTLTPGVRLSGTVDTVRVIRVAAMRRGLIVHATASARATLHVER